MQGNRDSIYLVYYDGPHYVCDTDISIGATQDIHMHILYSQYVHAHVVSTYIYVKASVLNLTSI